MIAATASESPVLEVLIDGSGLGDNDSDRLIEHSTKQADMWITKSDALGEGIIFDLPAERVLESIGVWNYNRPAYTDMGVATCDVSVWTAGGGWKTILKGAKLQEAEGTDDYDEPTILTFDPVAATKVRLENLTAFNSKPGQVGLSEVAFYEPLGPTACNPEPAVDDQIACLDVVPLVWTAGRGAIAHDVYIGQKGADPVLLGRIKGSPEIKVSGLSANTDYVWRIDEVAKDGSVSQGSFWAFHVRGQQIAHWTLDGTADDALGQFSGTVRGDPAWQAGHNGQALQLNGQDNYIEAPALNLNTDTLTICAWINVGQPAPSRAGIAFCRAGHTVAGFNLRGTRLGYHWNDMPDTYNWSSGLTVPQDQWVFTALTVVPGKGTLYLYDGNEFKSAENTIQHTLEEFDGPLCIGYDSLENNNRYFKGAIDDVRIYDFALSQSQIEAIAHDETVSLNEQGEIQLVDANLVPAEQSLAQIAAEAEKEGAADESKKSNLIAVVVIVLVIAVFAVFSITRKKK